MRDQAFEGHEALVGRIRVLQGEFPSLADAVRERVEGELRQGRPPADETLERLRAARDAYRAFEAELTATFAAEPVPCDLGGMIATIERVAAAKSWSTALRAMQTEVARILRIRYQGTPPPRCMEDLHDRARRLLADLEVAAPADPRFQGLDHWDGRVRPFRDLWRLLTEELEDAQADEILDRLHNDLGGDLLKPMTFRRLVIAPEDEGERESPPPPPETLATVLSGATEADLFTPPASNPKASPPDRPVQAPPIDPAVASVPEHDGEIGPAVSEAPSPADALPSACAAVDEAPVAIDGQEPTGPDEYEQQAEAGSLFWGLLGQGRAGLAYHVARCADGTTGEDLSVVREIARAAALGSAVRSSSGEVVEQLSGDVLTLLESLPRWQSTGDQSLPRRLVLFGASLRPALLAPATGAVGLLQELRNLDNQFEGLGEIRRAVVEFGKMSFDLSPSVLKGVQDHAVWEQRLDELRSQARAWLDSNRHAKIIYDPTTDVWRRWLSDGAPLSQTLRLVIQSGADQVDAVREAVKHWGKKTNVEKELSRTDAEIRKIGARRRPIEARAQRAICERVEEFVQIAQDWLDLIAAEPRPLRDPRHQRADQCRELVRRALPRGIDEVASLEQASGDKAALPAAARFTRAALQDIGRLFDQSQEESTRLLPVRIALGSELLALPGLSLDADWMPVNVSPERLFQLLRDSSAETYDPSRAFRRHVQTSNHLATARIIESLEALAGDPVLIEALRAERGQAVDDCRSKLRREIDVTRRYVERAVCHDLVTEEERAQQLAIIKDCDDLLDLDDDRDFGDDLLRLQAIRAAIDEKRSQRIMEVQQKLEDTDFPAERAGDRDVILRAIDRMDYHSADEYLELVRKNQPLVRAAESPAFVFAEFFPRFVQQFNAFMEGEARSRPEVRSVMDAIRQGRSVGPVDMRGVPLPRAIEAADMVEAWGRLKNRVGEVPQELTRLLIAFGLRRVQTTLVPSPEKPHFLAHCETKPVGDPNECIIPAFGSLAEGRYAVLGLFERPDEEVIVNLGHKAGGRDRPVIILYFGRMTEPRRRDLAELCWQRRRSLLVVDEALVYFLCNVRFSRLPILFQSALPFTLAEPYTTTASLVPIEMFFGREQERRSVIDPFGTNLLYGGRQLGKSALLRDVVRREHDRESGKIVCWIDLKNRGIGISQSINDVWAEIGQTLHKEKVLPQPASNAKTVADQIKRWLEDRPERRILLLLDEADAFLEADSMDVNEQTRHSFPTVSRLKGLMDDTNRRFKVVFAGLHNVQRAARDPNTPVAHLGTPVCIGPLLDRGEWRQARDLIEVPFRHMGYEFDPPDLSMRILSYTNYYPSLIQIFCRHLLEHLHSKDRTTFDFRSCPPYKLTTRHVEEVYQSEDLQREIGHRFELTLNLDNRYRLIALCIALASIERRGERALVDGFAVAWVREQALSWWAGGFAEDNSFELFRTILDEMIGLGVLRAAGPDRYALRSANVLNLLGSKKQIEEKILDVPALSPSPRYEAATFRRTLGDDAWTRSPLTAEQEGSLIDPSNGVAVLCGSPLSGLNDLRTALQSIPTQPEVCFAGPMGQLSQFSAWLADVDETRVDGLTLAVVDHRSGWESTWVRAAADLIRRKTSARKRFLRVVFVADPHLAWKWSESGPDSDQGVRVTEIALRPWREAALRRWMEDAEFGADAVSEGSIVLEKTGGWGMLIHAFGARCRGGQHGWRNHLEAMLRSWPDAPCWGGCHDLPQAARPILKVMADWDGTISVDELTDLAQAAAPLVPRVLAWADRLSYVRAEGADGWRLDPVVRSLVLAARE